jgi:hypothetical protein
VTPQERLDYLLADVWVPTNAVVTLAVIRDALPQQAYGLVLVTLANAKKPQADTPEAIAAATEMEGVFIALNGAGISLSSPDRQAVIDQLATAGQWPDAVRDAVKALGGVIRKRWQVEGYEAEPTLQSIQAEIDAEIAEPDETRYEVLLSANRASDGALRVMARVTPVYFAAGTELRRGEVRTLVNDAALVAALSPIVEGLIDA